VRQKSHRAKDTGKGKMFAVLSYLTVLCIIPLLLKKDNDFVLSHGKQGLVLFVAEVAVFIAHIVFGSNVLHLGFFVLLSLSLWGVIEVFKGHDAGLPFVGHLAQKIVL